MRYALGIDINNYKPEKLRYGKIAICVDPDDDGAHIALLIMANLHKLCPEFLKENRLFWLRSPLFIEHDKNANTISWYYTDADFIVFITVTIFFLTNQVAVSVGIQVISYNKIVYSFYR